MGRRVKKAQGGSPLAVLKFGSSVLEGAHGFHAAAEEIACELTAGRKVVAVVSAPPGATDALLRSAGELSPAAPGRLVSRLLATGEAASVALLAIALAERGIPCSTLDAQDLDLRTRGPALDAHPHSANRGLLRLLLERDGVVVVSGFIGVDEDGELCVLGRGGSDLTALFLAVHLEAEECRLVKDVDGVFAADPRHDPTAPVFRRATWDVVMEVGGELVQEKAVRFARDRGRSFRVAAFGGEGTWVGAVPPPPLQPIRNENGCVGMSADP